MGSLSIWIKSKLSKDSKAEINKGIKELEKTVNALKLVARLKLTDSKTQINDDINKLSQQVEYLKLKAKIDKRLARTQLSQDISSLENTAKTMKLKTKVDHGKIKTDVQTAINQGQASANKDPIDVGIKLNEAQQKNLIAKIQSFGVKNSKLFKSSDATFTYSQLLEDAYGATSKEQMRDVTTRLATFREQLNATGLAGLSFSDKMKKGLGTAFSLFGLTGTAMMAFNVIRNQTQEIMSLDKAMTSLWKVQDDISGREDFPQYLERCIQKAQDLAVKTRSLIDSATEWSKIGFNLEKSSDLAEVGVKLENVGDMNITKATQTLISAGQAFKEVDGFMDDQYVKKVERIGDKINAIGNKYSISTEGLADYLQNASAALSLANNTLDESISLAATGNKIFQAPDEFGNAMKVGAMRLRGQKGELEKLGEDVDGMVEGVSKIQTQILNLSKGKVNIFESDNETLKSTYKIYTEIGKAYKDMSDKDQASIVEILFGKQRGSAGAGLLLNIEEASKVYQDSLNAAGSMDEEFAKHQESAEAAVIRLQESIIGLSSNVLSGDLVKNLSNAGTSTITFADNMHLLEIAIKAVIGVGIAKFALGIGKTFTEVSASVNNFSSAMNLLNSTKKTGFDIESIKKMGQATKNLTDEQLKLFMSNKTLDDQTRTAIINSQGLTNEKKAAKLATLGLDTATKAETASTVVATTATFSLKGAILGLGAAIKNAFLSNPLGWVIVGLSTAIPLVTSAFDALTTSTEEHAQKLEELSSEYEDNQNQLKSMQDELQTTKNRIAELQGKPVLTLVEKDELAKLKETNSELERSIQLLKIQNDQKLGEIQETTVDTMDSAYGGTDFVDFHKMFDPVREYQQEIDDLSVQIDAALKSGDKDLAQSLDNRRSTVQDEMNKLKSSLGKDYDFLKDKAKLELIPDPKTDGEQRFNEWILKTRGFVDEFGVIFGGQNAKKTAFDRLLEDKGFSAMSSVLQSIARSGGDVAETLNSTGFENFKSALDKAGLSAKDVADILREVNEQIDKAPEPTALEKLTEAYKTGAITMEEYSQKYKKLTAVSNQYNDEIHNLSSAQGMLEGVQKKVTEGQALSKDEMNQLVGVYPALTGMVYQVADGYMVEKSAIDLMVESTSNLQSAYITMQTAMTNIAASGMEQRLGFVLSEIKTMQDAFNVIHKDNHTGFDAMDEIGQTLNQNAGKYDDLTDYASAISIIQREKNKIGKTDFSKLAPTEKQKKPKGSGKSKSGSEKDAWLEAFNKEHEALQRQQELGKISEEQYYNSLLALTNKYFKGKAKYADEYNKYIHEVRKGHIKVQRDNFNEFVDMTKRTYDKTRDAGRAVQELTGYLKTFKDVLTDDDIQKTMQDIADFKQKIFDNKISDIEFQIKVNEQRDGDPLKDVELLTQAQEIVHQRAQELRKQGFSDESEAIRNLKNQYTSYADDKLAKEKEVTDKITELLNKQKDELENKITYATNIIDDRIKALEDQKKALQDVNEQNEREIELEKRKDDLFKARTQRNIQIFHENVGFVYEADQEAIEQAQKALDDYNFEEQIRAIDDQIEAWQDYKDEWTSIADKVAKEQNRMIIEQQQGTQLEADILSRRLDTVRNFASEYMAAMNSIKLMEGSNSRAVSVGTDGKAPKGLTKGTVVVTNGGDYIITDVKPDGSYVSEKVSGGGSSSSSGSSSPSNSLKYADANGNAPANAQIGDTIRTNGGDYFIVGKNADGSWKSVKLGGSGSGGSSSGSSSSKSSSSSGSSWVQSKPSDKPLKPIKPPKYANGTMGAPEDQVAIVDEEGEELIFHKPDQGKYTFLEKGDGVLPADITARLMALGAYPNAFLASHMNKLQTGSNMPMPTVNNRDMSTTVHIDNINLPHVRDSNDFARDLNRNLANIMMQEKNKTR